jgi:hypothetical protein
VASLARLRRRLLRWNRYVQRYPYSPWIATPPGHDRAASAVADEEERRFWDETPEVWLGGPEGEAALVADVLGMPCRDCGLPDLHRGQGDGIGSCDCPRCRDCGAAPGDCDGHDEPCEHCEDPACYGDCWGEEDTSSWPPDVVTEHAFAERGLL